MPFDFLTRTAPPSLDPDLQAFIEQAFPSVWALETFLALKRDSEAEWSVDSLVGELRANTALVSDCLTRLETVGLVVRTPLGCRFRPASQPLARLSEQLQAVYAERPFSVINVITSNRPDPLKGFADSFRLGGRKP